MSSFLFKKNGMTRLFLCVMLILPILHFAVFWMYVNLDSILLAFRLDTPEGLIWSGSNFERLFSELSLSDSNMRRQLGATLSFFPVNILIALPLSVVFSYFLYKKVPASGFCRVVFFLPSIISAVALTLIFQYMVNLQGPVNALLAAMGADKMDFLGADAHALKTVLFYTLWTGLGYNIILLSSAIGRIPQSIFESARIEGVGIGREIFALVVPMIWSTISTLVVIGVANLFTTLGPVLLLTEGKHGTDTIAFFIYNQVKFGSENAYGYASATGLFFSCIGVPLVLFVKWGLQKITEGVEA